MADCLSLSPHSNVLGIQVMAPATVPHARMPVWASESEY